MVLELPWPPSVNTYWRRVVVGRSVRTLISRDGRAYARKVEAIVRAQKVQTIRRRCAVWIEAYPPDRRKRDLDNLFKAPLDALVKAGVLADDSLIDRLEIERREVVDKPGAIWVWIEEIR